MDLNAPLYDNKHLSSVSYHDMKLVSTGKNTFLIGIVSLFYPPISVNTTSGISS